jgi:very-short-patch-repair endonuclease
MNVLELASNDALERLERHRHRRAQRVPTLSLVVGPVDSGRKLVRRWAAESNLLVIESQSKTSPGLVADWFRKLADSRNLIVAACTWLSARTEHTASELSHGLSVRSSSERTLFFEQLFGGPPVTAPDVVCQTILEHVCRHGSTSVGLWEKLSASCAHNIRKLLAGLIEVVGADWVPALLVTMPAAAEVEESIVMFDGLTALVTAAPSWHVAVLIDPPQLELVFAQMSESHATALVREGLISVPTSSQGEPFTGDRDTDAATRLDDVADEECPSNRKTDPARSHAERFLFERLASHPETAGLFELNGRILPSAVPVRPREIDLLARSVRVAVEIDGYYHFADLDAYRRDRRKDVILQNEGYIVVRCLADDVVARLEDILRTIIEAVRLRRRAQSKDEENSR